MNIQLLHSFTIVTIQFNLGKYDMEQIFKCLIETVATLQSFYYATLRFS